MKKVADIIDLKNCIEGVQKAMESEDYEAAAAHIQRYLNIDESVLDSASSSQLKESQQKLKDIVQRKLEDAMKANNEKDIMRFCCLYPVNNIRYIKMEWCWILCLEIIMCW